MLPVFKIILMKNKVLISLSALSIMIFILSSCTQKGEEQQSGSDLKEVQDFQKSMESFEDLSSIVSQLSVLQDQSQTVSETSTSEK